MKKDEAARQGGPTSETGVSESVARAATWARTGDPAQDPLVDLLLAPPAADPETEALRLFPGRSPVQRLRRAAVVEIAIAAEDGAAGVSWLERAREIVAGELGVLDSGPTLTEDAIAAANELLAQASRRCRRALLKVRRARESGARRPGLKVVR